MMKERLQKLLSSAGVASRRASEELISAGRVAINGVKATVGMSADPDTDVITLDGERLRFPSQRMYIMLNKPRGYVTTLSDEKGRKTVAELVASAGRRLYPVGRLDLNSEGLLIMTDDGDVANALMHPSHEVRKLYRVTVSGAPADTAAEALRQPMEIDGRPIIPAKVRVVGDDAQRAVLEVGIREGRNRQVRKMCAIAGLEVHRLTRIAEGELLLGDLKPGKWRHLTQEERQYLEKLR